MRIHTTFLAVLFAGLASLQIELSLLREATFALGSSAFTNSFIISTFLAGLAFGSYLGNGLTRHSHAPAHRLFTWSQLLLLATVLALLSSKSTLIYGEYPIPLVLLYFFLFTLVPALIAGANFSFFLNMLYLDGEKYVAWVYAVSTAGNVIGGFLHGLVLVPHLGMLSTYLFVLICTGIAIIAVQPVLRPARVASIVGGTTIAVVTAVALERLPAEVQDSLLFAADDTYGRVEVFDRSDRGSPRNGDRLFAVYIHGEINCTNSATDLDRHERAASTPYQLLDGRIRRVLILGYCSGATVDAFLDFSELSKVVVVDQNHTVFDMAKQFFPSIYQRVHGDPRADVRTAEFKRYVRFLAPEEQFDVVVIDLTLRDPFYYGLFTLDFWRLVKAHMVPGGIVGMNVVHPRMLRTTGEAFRHLYRHDLQSGTSWYYLTDREIAEEARRAHGLTELFPWHEPGLVYSDHEVHELDAGERLEAPSRRP